MGVAPGGLVLALLFLSVIVAAVWLGARAINKSRREQIEAGVYDQTAVEPPPRAAPPASAVPGRGASAAGGTCGTCGGPLKPEARFCKGCGSPASSAPAGARICGCGAVLKETARFCKQCGTSAS